MWISVFLPEKSIRLGCARLPEQRKAKKIVSGRKAKRGLAKNAFMKQGCNAEAYYINGDRFFSESRPLLQMERPFAQLTEQLFEFHRFADIIVHAREQAFFFVA